LCWRCAEWQKGGTGHEPRAGHDCRRGLLPASARSLPSQRDLLSPAEGLKAALKGAGEPKRHRTS